MAKNCRFEKYPSETTNRPLRKAKRSQNAGKVVSLPGMGTLASIYWLIYRWRGHWRWAPKGEVNARIKTLPRMRAARGIRPGDRCTSSSAPLLSSGRFLTSPCARATLGKVHCFFTIQRIASTHFAYKLLLSNSVNRGRLVLIISKRWMPALYFRLHHVFLS